MNELQEPVHDHVGIGNPTTDDPRVIGRWEMIDAEFTNAATHVALLPTNKIFAYGGSSLDPDAFQTPPPAEILDLDRMESYPLSMAGVNSDVWCGGHTFLADGRLLIAGGTAYYPRGWNPLFGGLREAYLFNPFDESFERLPDMRSGRWYPTLIRTADNEVLAIAGTRDRFPELLLFQQERYHPDHGWRPMAQRKLFPLYPRLHLLPNGSIFYAGIFNTHYQIPWAFPSALWQHQTGRWQKWGGAHVYPAREEGISLLLALRPPNYAPHILVAGGGHHNKFRFLLALLEKVGLEKRVARFRHNQALDSVERIDLSQAEPRWREDVPMNYPRLHAVGVLLPDGQVAVIGGMSHHSHHHDPAGPTVGAAVRHAELYDPVHRRWQIMAAQERPRVYHSTALLLPDGRVISMGGNPYARIIEHRIEIFSPPYLFRGDRPVITNAPRQIPHGAPFQLKVNQARAIAQIVLMRPEVLTHVTNTDQRLLELHFRVLSDDGLEVEGPPTRAHMPQGFVLLFVLNEDGVPSVGRFVQVV